LIPLGLFVHPFSAELLAIFEAPALLEHQPERLSLPHQSSSRFFKVLCSLRTAPHFTGATIDFLLSAKRDAAAAERFQSQSP